MIKLFTLQTGTKEYLSRLTAVHKTWKLIFKQNDKWNSFQTFKATVDHTDHLWTWQMLRGVKVRLCIYSLNEQGSIDNNAKCQNVKVPGSSYMSFHPGNLLVVNKTIFCTAMIIKTIYTSSLLVVITNVNH